MTRFCLWDEPWIPVTRRTGGTSLFSIRDTLALASELREVYDPSPLVTVAIHRLLMAVLYRVYQPRSSKDWAGLWRAGRFDVRQLDEYGAAWVDRFDLFHPSRPFYQVPHMGDEKTHPISALVIEAASGNNPTLFDHGSVEGGEALTPDRAACHLVAHQLFAVGGGVSKPFNRMDGPLTKGLVVEARSRNNLFETLLLNLMPLDNWTSLVPESAKDQPFWELGSPPEPEREGMVPYGPLHYLTWQSRQIHLCVDTVSTTDSVTGCQIRQRYCLPKDGGKVDPWKPYRRDKQEGWLPLKIDRQRAVWHSTDVLLQMSEDDDRACPLLIRWLAEVTETGRGIGRREGLTVPPVVVLCIAGLTTDPQKAAKIELWRRETLPLPTEFLDNVDLVGELKDLLAEARRAETLLQRTGLALMWALGERQSLPEALAYFWTGKPPGGKIPDQLASLAKSLGMVTRYWPALEAPFRRALEELPLGDFAAAHEHWQGAVRGAAGQALQMVRDDLLYAEASYEVLSRIDNAFRVRLTHIFDSARDNEGGKTDDEESHE